MRRWQAVAMGAVLVVALTGCEDDATTRRKEAAAAAKSAATARQVLAEEQAKIDAVTARLEKLIREKDVAVEKLLSATTDSERETAQAEIDTAKEAISAAQDDLKALK